MGKHGEHEHHVRDVHSACCMVLSVSDSRDLSSDTSGRLAVDLIRQRGHTVEARVLVPDEASSIRAAVLNGSESGLYDAIVVIGGTGIAPRDVTPEALEPLFKRRIPGFGEAFRRLSVEEIGPLAILSRAMAGVVDHTLVLALPGSPAACQLGIEKLVLPILPHALGLISSRSCRSQHSPD